MTGADQLSLENADLLGARWTCEYGDVTVTRVAGVQPEGFVRVVVERPEKGTAFDAVLPAAFARRELAASVPGGSEDEWLSLPGSGGRDFYNATRNRELAALGLVPLAEPARETSRRDRTTGPTGVGSPAESRQPAESRPTERRADVPATTKPKKPAKGKKSGIASLSKAKLREYLLSHQTIADRAWNATYGAPAREKGESREQYVKRVLA